MEEKNNLRNWASILDEPTRLQAEMTARLPILAGPVALMPDAHLGMGCTIGTVIPTESAVIPSAVGVDIGCGMAARELAVTATLLKDAFDGNLLAMWVREMGGTVPAGLGHWDAHPTEAGMTWFRNNPSPDTLENPERALKQLGTLGGGNHFVEIAEDENDRAWILLHSGSRGPGNKLATLHTRVAKKLHAGLGTRLEDPELAWLQDQTPEFDAYIRDLRWSQAFALENRRQIIERAHKALNTVLDRTIRTQGTINCHHNYTEREKVGDKYLWVTRKGAIRAGVGDFGLIPGSMGQKSYVVKGLGNPLSYQSCSHGAGRLMSRTRAHKELRMDTFKEQMEGVAWQAGSAQALMDEAPNAYKPIEQVMADQADLVEVVTELKAIANYKGVDERRRRR